jgi:hypothetical protein
MPANAAVLVLVPAGGLAVSPAVPAVAAAGPTTADSSTAGPTMKASPPAPWSRPSRSCACNKVDSNVHHVVPAISRAQPIVLTERAAYVAVAVWVTDMTTDRPSSLVTRSLAAIKAVNKRWVL